MQYGMMKGRINLEGWRGWASSVTTGNCQSFAQSAWYSGLVKAMKAGAGLWRLLLGACTLDLL